jgi:hypothetical protein
MHDMLVNCGFVYEQVYGVSSSLPSLALGPSDLFSCMKLNTYQNLVPRISGWNSRDSSVWDITPWTAKPYTFLLESTHISNGPAKTKNYGWCTSFEYMLMLPTQFLHHTLNLNISRLLTVWNEGETWLKILKSYVLPSRHTVHMLCTIEYLALLLTLVLPATWQWGLDQCW